MRGQGSLGVDQYKDMNQSDRGHDVDQRMIRWSPLAIQRRIVVWHVNVKRRIGASHKVAVCIYRQKLTTKVGYLLTSKLCGCNFVLRRNASSDETSELLLFEMLSSLNERI